MKKTDLANKIAEKYELSKRQGTEMVEMILGDIMETVRKGDEVSFSGFGVFKVVDRKERMGINPKTGERIKIAASRKLKFRPAKAFKDLVK